MTETGSDTDLWAKVDGLCAEVSRILDAISRLVATTPRGGTIRPELPAVEGRGKIYDAYEKGFEKAVQGPRLLEAAGYSDATTAEPELIEVTREARQVAIRMAASRVIGEDGEEDEEDVEDRGKGAQAKLPPGVSDWPPRPFLARQKKFTKPWQVYLLK